MITVQTIAPQQELLLTAALQQALHILQLPIDALAEWIIEESERNPLIEVQEKKRSNHALLLQEQPASVSLYEHLLAQLPLAFTNAHEQSLAEEIIGNLNEKGFLEQADNPPDEKIRKKILQLDPPGVGCFGPQDYLLFQLEERNLQGEWIYNLVAHHFDLLLQGKWHTLSSKLKVREDELQQQIKTTLSQLRLSPVNASSSYLPPITPDLIFSYEEEQWKIEINTAPLPCIRIHNWRAKGETAQYIKEKRKTAKWLVQACQKRTTTLLKIGKTLLQKQRAFFLAEGRGLLIPLTCKEVAEIIGMHESTVTRAISNKYLSCPSGIFKMEQFFKQGVASSSNESIKTLLQRVIHQENKAQPLSDRELLEELKKRGIICARRTIAKYREALKIPSSDKRKSL